MLGRKKALLKIVINTQFSNGINKTDLLNALEHFIDQNYPESGVQGKYITARWKAQTLHDLIYDIKQAGGLDQWKKKLIIPYTPVIGSLSPKNKKQKQENQG